MKKRLITILFLIFLIFGNNLSVFAKKEISFYLDYFFDDGSMNEKYYGKMPIKNEDMLSPKEKKKFKNKTNANHALALYTLANCSIKKLEKKNYEISKKEKKEILGWFMRPLVEPNYMLKHIKPSGIQYFCVNEKEYDILKKILKILDKTKITKNMFNKSKEEALNEIRKELKIKEKLNKTIAVRPDLFKKQSDGSFMPKKDWFKDESLKNKTSIVPTEEEAEIFKDQKGINLLKNNIKEVEKTTYRKVKLASKSFKCKKVLKDRHIFIKNKDGTTKEIE